MSFIHRISLAMILCFCVLITSIYLLSQPVQAGDEEADWVNLDDFHKPTWRNRWIRFGKYKRLEVLIPDVLKRNNEYVIFRIFAEDVDSFDTAYFRVNDSPIRYPIGGRNDEVLEQRLAVPTSAFTSGVNTLTFINLESKGAIRVRKLGLLRQKDVSRNELESCATGIYPPGTRGAQAFPLRVTLKTPPVDSAQPPKAKQTVLTESEVSPQNPPVSTSTTTLAHHDTFKDRAALVIGNAAYSSSPLANPVNDAQDMAHALEHLGFNVELLVDADQRDMEEAVHRFGSRLGPGVAGLFYYAGHGIQVRGENYLIPVDADVRTESDIRYEAVNAGRILGKMQDADNALNIVILDACRNNPFARSFRSVERGLARMDAPVGSIVAFSTAPGSVAADGLEDNGLYTRHLLRHIVTPNLNITDILMRTRIDVAKASQGQQIPWESSSLMGYFVFSRKNKVMDTSPKQNAGTSINQEMTVDQPTISLKPKEPLAGSNNPTMAVLPFRLGRFTASLNSKYIDERAELVDAVVKDLIDNGFKPTYSYYSSGVLAGTPVLGITIDQKTLFQLQGKYFVANPEYCRSIGKRLGVDVIVTALLSTSKSSGNSRGVTPVIVDVHTGKLYAEKATFPFSTGRKYWQMDKVPPKVREVAGRYLRDRKP